VQWSSILSREAVAISEIDRNRRELTSWKTIEKLTVDLMVNFVEEDDKLCTPPAHHRKEGNALYCLISSFRKSWQIGTTLALFSDEETKA
jgi:hypothetical protein